MSHRPPVDDNIFIDDTVSYDQIPTVVTSAPAASNDIVMVPVAPPKMNTAISMDLDLLTNAVNKKEPTETAHKTVKKVHKPKHIIGDDMSTHSHISLCPIGSPAPVNIGPAEEYADDEEEYGEDEYDDEGEEGDEEEYEEDDVISLTPSEIDSAKDLGLAKLRKYMIRGYESDRKFNRSNTLNEINTEIERLEDQISLDNGIAMCRKVMIVGANVIESVEKRFNICGLKLDGWSVSLYENIDEFDSVFEELHHKYKLSVSVPPEIKLLGLVFMSAYMHHSAQPSTDNDKEIRNQMFAKNPALKEEWFKTEAEIAKETIMNPNANQTSNAGLKGSIMSLVGGMFSGGGGMGGIGGGPTGGVTHRPRVPKRASHLTKPIDMSPDLASGIEDEMSGPEDDDNMLSNLADEELDLSDIESISEV